MQQNLSLVGIAIAIGSGFAIGIQSTFFALLGRVAGPVKASLILNVTAGIIGAVLVVGAVLIQGRNQWTVSGDAIKYATVAAIMGIFIIMGITTAYQRIGVTAGLASLFLGQMVIGIVVDAMGWAGGEPIPVDLRRIAGLLVMFVALYFLVPRQ